MDRCHSYNHQIGEVPEVALDPPSWSERIRPIMVDACIAPTVVALWAAGHITLGSCCGHGRKKPSLVLDNGERDYAGVRAVIAMGDHRAFDLLQWQLVEITPLRAVTG